MVSRNLRSENHYCKTEEYCRIGSTVVYQPSAKQKFIRSPILALRK